MSNLDLARFTTRRGKPKYITKDGKTYAEREGRLIEVEIMADAADTKAEAAKAKRDQREANLFGKVPLKWASAATKALGAPQAFLLVWLHHLAWVNKSATFPVSNAALARYGISRGMKRRALQKLEAAGLIKTERLPGRATIVTLLNT
jgi:hypothetical protein